MSIRNKQIGHYLIDKKIGHGSYASIYSGQHDVLGIPVAVKFINRQKVETDELYKKTLIEIEALRSLDHPNVLKLFEVISGEKFIYLILEYCSNRDMYALLEQKERLTEPEARFYFRQILEAMIYCHSMGYSHRDLKPENILLGSHNNVKVADFGLCSKLTSGDLMKTDCGSLRYAAPEVISKKKYSGELADSWSCGVVLFTFLAGYCPFDDECYVSILKKIMRRQYLMPNDLTVEAVDLITKILEVSSQE